jgi:hypothetical protein
MSLFSTSGYATQERLSGNRLKRAFVESRIARGITRRDRCLLYAGARKNLGAVNQFARVAWGKAFFSELEAFFELDDDNRHPDQPLFFVTLTDVSCTTSTDAGSIDINKFKRKLQSGLSGLSYVGMIEPGLYVNVAAGTKWPGKKAVSWHLHAVCWGVSRKEIRQRFRRLNRAGRYQSLMGSQLGAHQKQIPDAFLKKYPERSFLADKLRYLLKVPKNAYRIYKTERVAADGECVACFRQSKSELRHGDRITLFHLMKDLYLDELAVAGGEGTDVLRRIKKAVLRVGPSGF